jgi:hypothetical protein
LEIENYLATIYEMTDKQRQEQRLLLMGTAIFFICVGLAFFFFRQHILIQTEPQPIPTPPPLRSENITIYAPQPDERVSQDFEIKGQARVFENVVSFRVSNKLTGKVYSAGSTLTNAPGAGKFGELTHTIHLKQDRTLISGEKLLLEVFQASPKDGSEIDKITIPITFTPVL